MRAVILACAILGVTVVSGSAQEMPRYDVEAGCRQMSTMTGGSEFMKQACFQQEQSAYDGLKRVWAQLPDGIKSTCEDMARIAGPNYFMLQACVQQELAAARSNASTSFRY